MNQIFLLGAGFTRAVTEEVIGKKALLTDEIMPQLDISDFSEIIDNYEETFPNIEQFISLLDLRWLRFKNTNKTLENRFSNIRDNIVEQIVRFFDVDRLDVKKLNDDSRLKKFINEPPRRLCGGAVH